MYYMFVALCAYLIGCSSMSLYLSKLKGIDLRSKGSKNLGASNTMLLIGWKAGIIVALHDIAKASISVLLANYFFSDLPYIGAVAGVACVIGHIFPFYLYFKGGKGFASFIGMTLALNWRFALVLLLLVIIITLITDYIVVGTATAIFSVPVYFGITSQSWVLAAIIMVATIIITYKHRENFVRIYNGTEMRFRSAHRGEYR